MLELDISRLPADAQERIDDLCKNYESDLRCAAPCDPITVLDRVSPCEQPVLLYELLKLHTELDPNSEILCQVRSQRPEFEWVIQRVSSHSNQDPTHVSSPDPEVTQDSGVAKVGRLTVNGKGLGRQAGYPVPGQYVIGTDESADARLEISSGLAGRQACLVVEHEKIYLLNLHRQTEIHVSLQSVDVHEFDRHAQFRIAGNDFHFVVGPEPVSPVPVGPVPVGPEPVTRRSEKGKGVDSHAERVPEIDGFEIQRELGRGNFGAVFEALQQGTGKRFAIKCLLPEAAREQRLKTLFMREISVISQLSHPNVVSYHGFGIANDQPYLVLEYVDAMDFDEIVQRHAEHKQLRLIIGVIIKVLNALSHAHEKGIVHRDIKPSNILTGIRDRKLLVKVADFGLAKFFETAGYSGLTATGAMCGTISYMSPEQLTDSKYAEPDCDVYATAVCLYRLLTGTLPHHAEAPAEIIRKRLRESPLPIDLQNPKIPASLAAVVERALHPDRNRRFRSAEEFSSSLEPFAV